MSDSRASQSLVVALAFIAGLGVGAAGTLIAMRGSGGGTAGGAGAGDAAAVGAASSTPQGELVVGADDDSASASEDPETQAGGVFVNERAATQSQLDELKQAYGAAPPPGRYWYDTRSGLYGIWGHESAGYIRPGHDFGPLPETASAGNTGVFINGRNLNMAEALYIRNTFGAVYQGRWWLDGRTGNFGQEGSDVVMGNLVAAVQAAQRQGGGGGGGGYRWRDEINRSSGGAENGCVWVNAPGSSYTSAGC